MRDAYFLACIDLAMFSFQSPSSFNVSALGPGLAFFFAGSLGFAMSVILVIIRLANTARYLVGWISERGHFGQEPSRSKGPKHDHRRAVRSKVRHFQSFGY